jgi:hypothetical protein
MKAIRQRYAAVALATLSVAAWAQSPSPEGPTTTTGHTFSPEQRTEIEARDQLARTIATNVEVDAQGHSDHLWRVRLMSSLYALPSIRLRDIATQAHTLSQAHDMANAELGSRTSSSVSNSKALADVGDDLVFTPMTPCRFVDTRNGGSLIPKGNPLFTAFNTALFGSSYGGDSGCKVPGSGEIAIAANITVTVDSGAAGFLGIRPYGATTRSSLVNWPTGGTTGIANAAIITTALDTNGNYEFEAYAGGNTPNLIVDLFGYFAPAGPTALDCTVTGMSSLTLGAHASAAGSPAACPTGYTQVAIYCDAGTATLVGTSTNSSSDSVCSFNNTTNSLATIGLGAKCCRVP